MTKENCICRNFYELTRAYSLPMSIAPWFVAVCFSLFTAPSLKDIFLTFIVIVSLHLGANLFDDYIDVVMEMKKQKGDLSKVNFDIGKEKAKLILNKTFSLWETFSTVVVLFIIPLIIGVYYTATLGFIIPVLALITLVLSVLYPVATKWGLGELILGLLFGPLLTFGTYSVLSANFPFEGNYYTLGYFSISLALLTVVLVHTHSLMDFDYDIKRGKKTLCTILKTKSNGVYTLAVLIFLAYANVVYLMSLGILPKSFIFIFLTLPIAIKLVKSMNDYIHVNDAPLTLKWYFGPMGNWKKLVKCNCQYFMYRFYLARNLMLFFCIISGIVYVVTTIFNILLYVE